MILTVDEIQLIHTEAVRAGIHNDRNQLLFGISVEYTARLATAANPSAQLFSDLAAMNADVMLPDGVPLERWLRNAAYATRLFAERQKFFERYAEEAAQKAKAASASWIPAALRNIAKPSPTSPSARPMGLVSAASGLDPAVKAELAAQIAGAFAPDDLDLILLKCFSNARIRTIGPNREQATAVIAQQCIDLVERENLTVVFMGFVLGSPRCTADLRRSAIATFPELRMAGQPFATIVTSVASGLMRNVRRIVERLADKATVQGLSDSVDELKCYKALHEAVHQVKLSPQPDVLDDDDPAKQRRFRQDLRTYLVLLSTARIRATDALDELPPDSRVAATETGWVTMIGTCAGQIDVALKQGDIGAAELALAVTARTVDPLLNQLNDRIFKVAMALLDRLVAVPWSTLDPAQHPATDPIDDVIAAMAALRFALLTQVLEHTRWQETDDALFSLESNFKFSATVAFTKFARQWPVVRGLVQMLPGNDDAVGQTRSLRSLLDDIDHALTTIEQSFATAAAGSDNVFNSVMSDPYGALRSGTQEMFFNIDSELKRNCNDLVRIQAPLAMIATEIGA